MSSTAVCRGPVPQTTSCPSSSACPRTARAIIPCGGRDGACQCMGTGAGDPARAQGGHLVLWGIVWPAPVVPLYVVFSTLSIWIRSTVEAELIRSLERSVINVLQQCIC